jgi:hypothetical protein
VNLSPAIVHLPKGDAAGGTCSGVCVTGVTMPLADRRFASRLEIVGDQSGMLDALEPLRLRNLSSDGMLLESSHPLTVGSIHEFQLIDGSTSVRVRAAVRHMSLGRQSSADRYFLVGLEFLNLQARSSEVLERILNQQSAKPAPEGV